LTTEGDPVRCVTARWRVDAKLALAAFDATTELIREGSADEPAFGWLAPREELRELAPDTLPPGAVMFESSPIDMPDAIALGTFYVEGDEVRYEGFSQRRLGWALELITDTLPTAELLETRSMTLEQMRQARPEPRAEPVDLPPEVIEDLRATMTERWLSEPVPALEGLTPRQADARAPEFASFDRGMRARRLTPRGKQTHGLAAR
jgi:hypothetical protein